MDLTTLLYVKDGHVATVTLMRAETSAMAVDNSHERLC
jgi:hypothetical protein